MENVLNPDENEDRVYHHQLSIDPNDQSTSETPVSLTMSVDSFVYPRTCSESTSGFSDQIDETNSSCSEPSPCDWPVLTESKSSKYLTTGLELQRDENLVAQEISEPGAVYFLPLSLCVFLYFFYFIFKKIIKCVLGLCRT